MFWLLIPNWLFGRKCFTRSKKALSSQKAAPTHQNTMPRSNPLQNMHGFLHNPVGLSETDCPVPPSCHEGCEQNCVSPDTGNVPSSHHLSSTRRCFTKRKAEGYYGMYELHIASRYVSPFPEDFLHTWNLISLKFQSLLSPSSAQKSSHFSDLSPHESDSS